MNTPFEPDAEFEKDPDLRKIINQLRSVKQEQVSGDFDSKFFDRLRAEKQSHSLVSWVTEKARAIGKLLAVPRVRYGMIAVAAAAILALLLIPSVLKPPKPTFDTAQRNALIRSLKESRGLGFASPLTPEAKFWPREEGPFPGSAKSQLPFSQWSVGLDSLQFGRTAKVWP